jgi:hypothetical protein
MLALSCPMRSRLPMHDRFDKDPKHSRAIAQEIGERLRAFLKEEPELPGVLESVRTLQAGLQSFLSMRRIEASRKNAKAFRLKHSQSLARRRQRLSHAMVRSTIQRFGKITNSLTPSERLTISMLRCGRTFATAFANFGPLYPLSTNSVFKNGNMPDSVVMTRAPPSRSWISAG